MAPAARKPRPCRAPRRIIRRRTHPLSLTRGCNCVRSLTLAWTTAAAAATTGKTTKNSRRGRFSTRLPETRFGRRRRRRRGGTKAKGVDKRTSCPEYEDALDDEEEEEKVAKKGDDATKRKEEEEENTSTRGTRQRRLAAREAVCLS